MIIEEKKKTSRIGASKLVFYDDDTRRLESHVCSFIRRDRLTRITLEILLPM